MYSLVVVLLIVVAYMPIFASVSFFNSRPLGRSAGFTRGMPILSSLYMLFSMNVLVLMFCEENIFCVSPAYLAIVIPLVIMMLVQAVMWTGLNRGDADTSLGVGRRVLVGDTQISLPPLPEERP